MASKEIEHAKVRIQSQHHKEIKINAYIRRLDKIYADLGKSPMLPKVVWKMRDQYGDDPHEFYKLVCQKYLITPEAEIDAYSLVYGKTESSDIEVKQDGNKVQVVASKQKDNRRDDWNQDEPFLTDEVKNKEPRDSVLFGVSFRLKQISSRSSEELTPTKIKNGDFPSQTIDSPSVRSVRESNSKSIEYVRVQQGDFVETMVVTAAEKKETGFWIPACILSIDMDNETMNLQVLQPSKYGVAKRAINVPYSYVRSPSNSRVILSI